MKAAFRFTVLALIACVAALALGSVMTTVHTSTNDENLTLTAVPGLKVGHYTLTERPTGCTVVLVDGDGAVGGVSQRGGAPGTRETDLLNPLNLVDKVNAVVLAGGSAYGLEAANGTVRWLEEHGTGWKVGAAGVVPIVPAAILFDLPFGGKPHVRPTAECGYRATDAASDAPVVEGNVGAGAGATVGGLVPDRLMKGGIGSAAVRLPDGLVVGAIVAVNPAGDVIDPATGRVVAGIRTADGKSLADTRVLMRTGELSRRGGSAIGRHTIIAVVATNARLTKADASRMALMADDGIAKAVSPSHTIVDGDTVFALATGRWSGAADMIVIGGLAAEVLAEAIVRAVVAAEASNGVPSARQLGTVPARFGGRSGPR